VVSSPKVRPFGSFAICSAAMPVMGLRISTRSATPVTPAAAKSVIRTASTSSATRWLGSLGSNQEHALEHEGGNGPGSTVESVKQACNTPYPVEEIVASRLRTEQLPVDSPAATSELRSAWPTEGAQ
jgi:hypothetical protein